MSHPWTYNVSFWDSPCPIPGDPISELSQSSSCGRNVNQVVFHALQEFGEVITFSRVGVNCRLHCGHAEHTHPMTQRPLGVPRTQIPPRRLRLRQCVTDAE